ncbi:phosphatidate cytidylyltransferase, mitochondrial [Plakobranchus ocellatus]|uniref:Phosphatidate cytidylyltransferase, mitochondrial n=1 Tax=Plakobranchus ocellatus TaxID=259542 RepID=A0AAV4AV04_9GAST|nr:phosphatidate cytidylyltransferase, mitochondrial [Plakobranchus ocellatus]
MKTITFLRQYSLRNVNQFSCHQKHPLSKLNSRLCVHDKQLPRSLDLSCLQTVSLWTGKSYFASDLQAIERSEKVTLHKENALVKQEKQRELYGRIVEAFPSGIEMAFAYGSGAFQQHNSLHQSKNMLDFIFVVNKPKSWHRQNIELHPHHYSSLRRLGPHTISRLQDRYGAGVYFNTLVSMEGRLIKYGVISTARLITDLLDWETLYISGRLHKPVSLIVIPSNEDLLTAMKVNLQSAVHAALLLLPDMFTEEQLFSTIAGLSYAGDFRMAIAEDSNKVKNIVKPNLALFRQMYGPILQGEEHVTWWQDEGQLEQALTFHSRHHHLKCLPGQVLYGLLMQKYQVGVFPDLEEIIKKHAYDTECSKYVSMSIQHIVKKSSWTQSIKGILSAGFIKTLRYSSSKLLKKLRSR